LGGGVMTHNGRDQQRPAGPDPALRALDRLVGTWQASGGRGAR
jgi:hypothetical protein